MRQIYPVQGPDLPLIATAGPGSVPGSVAQLALLYRNEAVADAAGPPGRSLVVRANMVASADGAATLDGRSGGLSGPADRMVFRILRSLADLVLVGAGTARTEHYRPVRRTETWPELRPDRASLPPVAVVTASLDLSGCEQLLTAPAGPSQTIVITTAAAPADRKAAIGDRARIIEAGLDRVDIAAAAGALTDLGYRHILAEGGPTLLGQLARAGLLAELCLTTSPVLAAGAAGRILAGPRDGDAMPVRLSLAHVLSDGDFLLCRYRVAQPLPRE